MTDIKDEIRERLFALQDLKYREFQSRLMPTVPKEKVIGVRTPMLRKLALELLKAGKASEFMKHLPHDFYEENNLHGFFIETIGNFEECIAALDVFLPYVDNWATCDMMSPKILKKEPQKLMEVIRRWISSENSYMVRYALGCLMKYYLEEEFSEEYLEMAAEVKSGEYYIRMMQAWYFATALAKQYEAVLPYLEERRLDSWVHQKTIQKAVESHRITKEKKDYLKSLR